MKSAFVTGTSSGIGAAIAQRLLFQGWRVEGFDRAAPSISHQHFLPHTLDLCDAEAVRPLIMKRLAAGTPDALVHAAGLMRTAPVGELDEADGRAMWQLHVEAAARLANQVLPLMRHARHGRVVFIGSRVSRGLAGRSQYAATKAALLSLARSFAAEVVADGVTVNVVSPAATDTPMLNDPGRSGTTPKLPPIGRLITPAEVAALVAFLMSDGAAAITGQDIAVCGGASLPR